MKKGYLVLQDGRVFEGIRFGAAADTVGELVFNTSVVGYIETLTDPAYAGQIVLQTYPLIGNYGMISADLDGKCCVKGYIAREICDTPSNFRTEGDLNSWLVEQGVPGLCGVDTRELTRIIRENGSMNAMICDEVPADLSVLETYAITGMVEAVSRKESEVFPAQGEEQFKVAMIDYGTNNTIINWFCQNGCTVTVLPATVTAEEVLSAGFDGVLLSNGPGDPAENTFQIQQVKAMLGKVPVFGIGQGHMILALANGGETYKLKYGLHGGNQPVRDLKGTRTYIASHNCCYAVKGETVNGGEASFVNVNDGICEGIAYPALKAAGVQFYPNSCASLKDKSLFNLFANLMKGGDR